MVKQNTPEWLELRKTKIGASDAPVIMGVSPWKTPFALWEEKLGLREGQATNFAMQRGHDLEPVALQAYNDYTGNCASPEVAFHKERDWMMASLDGVSLDREVIVEIKCPGAPDHELAAKGTVPDKYMPQVQHQLAVFDVTMAHYFSYRDGDFRLIEIERDDKYIAKMYAKEDDFWKRWQNFEPPALTERDYVERDDTVWISTASEWQEIQRQLEELKAKEKAHREQLIALASDHNTKGAGIRVQKVVRRGSVDYKKVPQLEGVDLDKFRKAPVETWRLTAKG